MERILIIGGTNFIGRNLIEKLSGINQFELTIFNRGITNPDLFPHITKLVGDRNTNDVQLIAGTNWDYIIDLSCYFPNSVDKILSVINQNIKRYIFVSTCSVYDNETDKSILRNENSILLDCNENDSIDTSAASYGKRKAACERLLQKSKLPYLIIRPSLVYGKYDSTDRFYYWLYQVQNQDEILIPNKGEHIFSVTFVDDLIKCIIDSINAKQDSEIYNVTSYPALSISKIVETVSNLMNRNPTLYYAKSDFLDTHQIREWVDLPLWLDCDYFTYSNSKLVADHDFIFTDFEISLKNTIAYFEQLNWPKPTYGLTDKRKQALINLLKKQEPQTIETKNIFS